MKTSKFMLVVEAAILLAACSKTQTEPGPNAVSPNAYKSEVAKENAAHSKAAPPPPGSSSKPPTAAVPPAGSEPDVTQLVRVDDDVLNTPAERTALKQHLRSQIFNKTKKIPEPEYEQLVRPSLVTQLRTAGFAQNDVDEILSDVDYSRSLQGIH